MAFSDYTITRLFRVFNRKFRGEIMLKMPEGYKYWYIDDESEMWCIKEDAPEWAKKEFVEYVE